MLPVSADERSVALTPDEWFLVLEALGEANYKAEHHQVGTLIRRRKEQTAAMAAKHVSLLRIDEAIRSQTGIAGP